jgi:hypothetical protein
MTPRAAAKLAVLVSLGVSVVWFVRPHAPTAPGPARETTVTVRAVRHDVLGFAVKSTVVREPNGVRAIVDALGVDDLPEGACPPDYAESDVSLGLFGADPYARRTAYVFSLYPRDPAAGPPEVVVTSAYGCRRGPPADAVGLARELARAKIGD